MSVVDNLRRWLRRIPLLERRWISDPDERRRHDRLVKRRLNPAGSKKPRP